MLFHSLGQSNLPVLVASPVKYMQTGQLLCWSGMTDTEHKTSSSNEKEARKVDRHILLKFYNKPNSKRFL